MKQKNHKEKRLFIKTEKKLSKTHYGILIGFMILSCFHYFFLEPQTIGKDIRYIVYVFYIPVIIGILVLGYYRRDFLLIKFAISKGIGLKLFVVGFYLLQGVFISFFSFGFFANAIWNYTNKKVAEQNPTEIINCKVDKFIFKRRESIFFTYKGGYEKIRVSSQSIKEYENKKSSNYDIELTVQKGVWNYYIVKSWAIIENKEELETTNTPHKSYLPLDKITSSLLIRKVH